MDVKICDFGCSKCLVNEKNTPYTSTWYYRAPELMLGATNYNYSIDMWSFGCMFGEILTHWVLFQGNSEGDQLFKIFKSLGSPSNQEM